MLDLEYVNQNANLLAIADGSTHLKRVAVSGGGEWAGPCPFCGGKDRFVVQPEMHRWLCRQCTGGKWRDVIDYIARRDGFDVRRRADLQEICRRAIGYEPPTTGAFQFHFTPQTYDPPDQTWQKNAALAIEECSQSLYQPSANRALEYLYSRKLQDFTIRKFNLGYSPGGQFGDLWIPKGITIPCLVDKTCWYLKVRLIPGSPCKCGFCKRFMSGQGICTACGHSTKYTCVKGSKTSALFGAGDLHAPEYALLCEGEFDSMIAFQELAGLVPALTLGSASNHPNKFTWGPYLDRVGTFLTIFDNDQAGQKGLEAISKELGSVIQCHLPPGVKDINQFVQEGGDLLKWIQDVLPNNTSSECVQKLRALSWKKRTSRQLLPIQSNSWTRQIQDR